MSRVYLPRIVLPFDRVSLDWSLNANTPISGCTNQQDTFCEYVDAIALFFFCRFCLIECFVVVHPRYDLELEGKVAKIIPISIERFIVIIISAERVRCRTSPEGSPSRMILQHPHRSHSCDLDQVSAPSRQRPADIGHQCGEESGDSSC